MNQIEQRLARISRCGQCGDWTLDRFCDTCHLQANRQAKLSALKHNAMQEIRNNERTTK